MNFEFSTASNLGFGDLSIPHSLKNFGQPKALEQALIPTNFDLETKKVYYTAIINNIRTDTQKLIETYGEVYNEIESMTENIIEQVRARESHLKREINTVAINTLSKWDYHFQICTQIYRELEKTKNFVNYDVPKRLEYFKEQHWDEFKFKKTIPKFVFGENGGAAGQFCKPWGVCSDPTGRIIVCDRWNHRIQIFNECGQYVFHFGKEGSDPGQFNRPSGVDVDSSFRIVVADKDNHRIQVFTFNGRFLFQFGREGTRPGEFRYPWDVSVNKNCEIAVSDSQNNRIQLFSPLGKFITLVDAQKLGFVNFKQGLRYFNSPRGLAFRSDGNLLATDFNNHCVLLINKTFTKVTRIGREGHGKGEFFRPQGVVCDDNGNFAVSDSKNYRVQVFKSNGDWIKSFGIQGCNPGEFDCPQGICFLANKNIAVVDLSNGRVQVFQN